MTLKKLIARDWRGLRLWLSPALFIDPSLGADRASGAPQRRRPRRPLDVNKGDNAWMMTSTVLVLLMTIPGLALFYAGLVRPKNVLSVLTHVFYTVCIVTVIWVIYGYSLAFTGGSAIIGGLDKLFLKGVTADSQAATFSVGVPISRERLHLLPDDVRGDHAGADRRRVRRAHEVLGGGAVHPAVGDAWSTSRSRTWSGIGPARTRSTPPPRRVAAAADGAAKTAAQAKLDEVMADARPGVPVGRHRLRRRHRGAHQLRHRRPGRRDLRRQAHRLRQGTDASALAGDDHDRRLAAVGRLVRLQRRLQPRSHRRRARLP